MQRQMRSCLGGCFVAAIISIALGGLLPGAAAEPREAPEATIRAVLQKWTADFNAGNAEEVCNLFSPELRYDFRGQSERNYKDICSLLHHSLEDGTKKYAYTLQIKEILVWDELAVVRLVWTLSRTASENTAPVPFESAYAIWTSWQHSCDRDDQALMQRGDRVGNVTLGPDRRRRGVGNYREWQVF